MNHKKIAILFVCHGNICRSPMAEFIMKDIVRQHGLQGYFHIESAATSSEELGNPVHTGTRKVLASLGIDCSAKRTRRIQKEDYQNFSMLIGMDDANMHSMRRAFSNDPEGKLYKLLEFAHSHSDVADPWYTHDFETCYQDVNDGCVGLMNFLQHEMPGRF